MKPKILSDKTAKKKIEAITGIHPLVAEILYNRGYKTQHEMEDFLQDHPLNDPFSIKDIEKGAEIIKDAINNKEKIVAYVDTDADGICSAGILVPTLRDLGADVEYYTNNKLRDGYGMCKLGVDNILAKWPDTKTIITADNGIVATMLSIMQKYGLKVVVTDHHEPGMYLLTRTQSSTQNNLIVSILSRKFAHNCSMEADVCSHREDERKASRQYGCGGPVFSLQEGGARSFSNHSRHNASR